MLGLCSVTKTFKPEIDWNHQSQSASWHLLTCESGPFQIHGPKMYNSAVTQTLIVMKTSCFLYDVYWRCLYLCFEECFKEFSAMVWLFLCRLGIWIHRVLCHVIHSICLWKCFGFLQVFKAMDCFQMCQWGVSIEEAEVRCIDRKNTCHQCFIWRELLKLLIAFRCGCEAADVKW
jgi:hypothetical protein